MVTKIEKEEITVEFPYRKINIKYEHDPNYVLPFKSLFNQNIFCSIKKISIKNHKKLIHECETRLENYLKNENKCPKVCIKSSYSGF